MPNPCIVDLENEPQCMACLHCGAREVLRFPITIREYIERLDYFLEQHRHPVHCRPLPPES